MSLDRDAQSTKLPSIQQAMQGYDYWELADRTALEQARHFEDLASVALRVLGRMPPPVGEVCGPISTGGKGSIAENLKEFRRVIDELAAAGKTVFDQMPFEDHIFRIIDGGYGMRTNNQLLISFYLPIFESGHIKTLYFIPGWESSHGATWEHEQGQRFGMHIIYL